MLKTRIDASLIRQALSDPQFESSLERFVETYMNKNREKEVITLFWKGWGGSESETLTLEQVQSHLNEISMQEFQGEYIGYAKTNDDNDIVSSVSSKVKTNMSGLFREKVSYEQFIEVYLNSNLRENFNPNEHNLPTEFEGFKVEYEFPQNYLMPSCAMVKKISN